MPRPSPSRISSVALVLLLSAGCNGTVQRPAPDAAQPGQVAVERVEPAAPKPDAEADRLGLHILIAQDSASFLDRRKLKLGKGSLRVSVHGVPSDLDPATVALRSLTSGARLELIEARFYGGTFSSAQLLGPYVGKEVVAHIWEEGSQAERAKQAILIGFADGLPVVSIDKQIRVLDNGRIAVPKLPDAIRDEPTLELLVTSDHDEQEVEIAYRSRRMDADILYQLVRPPGAQTAQIVGLVAASNESGTPLVNAGFLLSSETHEPLEFGLADAPSKSGDGASNGPPTTRVRLPAPLTLAAGQHTMVRLFGPTDVGLARKIVFEGPGLPSYVTTPEEVSNASVRAVLDAVGSNGEPLNQTGLVAGQAHLFERAANEPPRGYGAAAARPLPGARGVRVDLGDERKYPSRRRLVARKDLGRCVVETTWEVAMSNPTENALQVEDVEPVTGKYQVLESSIPVLASEPDHFVFGLTLPANSEVKLKFRVRTSGCIVKQRRYWQQWSKKGEWYGKGAK